VAWNFLFLFFWLSHPTSTLKVSMDRRDLFTRFKMWDFVQLSPPPLFSRCAHQRCSKKACYNCSANTEILNHRLAQSFFSLFEIPPHSDPYLFLDFSLLLCLRERAKGYGDATTGRPTVVNRAQCRLCL
jgi:hypothetical protein